MIGVCHHTGLSVEIRSHSLFCLGWSGTTILLIATSQVARITGMSHSSWPHTLIFLFSLQEFHFYLIAKEEHIKINQKINQGGCQWLTPVILDTQEAEISRMVVGSQPGQIVCEILS
jgi:hypothetical protein